MLNKNLFLFFFIILIVGSFVSAVKPDPQIIANGCEIRLPQVVILKQNQDINFHTHVINTTVGASNFLTNDTTNCFVHLYNYSGHTLQKNMSWDSNNLEWHTNILGGNFSNLGEFSFYIQCQAQDVICADAGSFEVTPTGYELTTPRIVLNTTLLFVLVLFFLISLFLMFHIEHYIAKFTLYWVSHLLLILITFIGWQYGVDGVLIGTAVTGIFRWLFLIITIAVFPMVILSITWIVYIHLFNEHFEKLLDKGEDPETAFALSKKKYGGWFSGR